MTTPALMAFEDARQHLLERAEPLTDFQASPLKNARSRLLAADLTAPINVPPYDNSAMDGYAVRAADIEVGARLPVSQRVPAGMSPTPLLLGSVARVFTGAPIPHGADAVVMQEQTEADGYNVTFLKPVTQGQNIRQRGEDIAAGSVVIPAGTQLSPAHIGLAASVGIAEVPVIRPLRVAVFFTGDELTEPGESLLPGRIYNSNRYWLRGLLAEMGCEIRDLGIVPDSLAATRLALADAAANSDVVITCGGMSVGEEDYVTSAVARDGHLDLWKIAMKPGKPFAFGKLGQADFIGLPGNPVSGYVTFLTLVAPFIRKRQGLPLPSCLTHAAEVEAAFEWSKPDPKRVEFLRVRRVMRDGRKVLEAYPHQGSGVLSSMAWADGLVALEAGQQVRVGDRLSYWAFDRML